MEAGKPIVLVQIRPGLGDGQALLAADGDHRREGRPDRHVGGLFSGERFVTAAGESGPSAAGMTADGAAEHSRRRAGCRHGRGFGPARPARRAAPPTSCPAPAA